MSDDKRLSLTFAVTEDDVRRFLRYHHLHRPKIRLWTWGMYAAWIFAMASMAATTDYGLSPEHPLHKSMPFVATALSIPISALAGVLFFSTMTGSNASQLSRHNIGIVGDRTLDVTPEELSWSMETGHSTHKWTSLARVVSNSEAIILYQGQNMAQLIPRRVFASPEAADMFLQLVKDWHAAATVSAPASSRDT